MARYTVKLCAIFCTLLCIGTLVAYAAVSVLSNQVTITPTSTPTMTLGASSTAPYLGDTITLTATIAPVLSGLTVTFRLDNSTVLGTGTTNGSGVATLHYTIISLDVLTVEAVTDVTSP